MYGHDRESPRGAWSVLLLCLALMLIVAVPARADVTARAGTAQATYASESTRALTVGVPAGAQAGDVLVASLGYGITGASAQPVLSAPAGWTEVDRTEQGSIAALVVYVHVLAAGESSFTWTTDAAVGGTAFVSAYAGVDRANPVDVAAGRSVAKNASVATPSLTTAADGEMLVASFFGYRSRGAVTWTAPSGMSELADAGTGSRSGSVDAAAQATAGSTGAKTAKASTAPDYALGSLTALRPATGTVTGSAPVISGVQAGSVTSSGATIAWTTDTRSDSQVEYGRTTDYGSSTARNATAVTSHSQIINNLASGATYHYRVRSTDSAGREAVSGDFTFTTASAGATVPVIVDTDMFSDADDVGALATAFGLQLKGEARVIALGVNTRTSRPSVATNSWKCVAAIASFYGAGSIPIGTSMPNNGTSTNSPDFTGPCARLAPSSTPTPGSAVSVYRRALADQADGSVVMVSVGYFGNLAALLNSAPDSISPLSGRDLVAKKVKTLVSMAGEFPSGFGETNLIGDPASAQTVAANWPTKIVWSGYEVGDAVHTGQTISRAHPTNSPVRAAYEAFVDPGNWIYSYDLTAVYHAIRPDDSLLREVGPGTNAVTSTGDNTWRGGSGNQYYLSLSSATQLDAAIEALLDTVPTSAPSDTTAPVISGVRASSVTTSGATISWSTDEASTSQVQYGTTTSYGSSTTLDGSRVTAHSQALSGLTAGTVYHYRVTSRDAAGNLATSSDATFTTTAAQPDPGPTPTASGPSDTFDATLDPAAWRVTGASQVGVSGGELQISHPAGAWTRSVVASTAYDQTGKAVRVQLKRAADDGQGGSSYGETGVFLRLDSSRYAYFFVGGGALTAWVNKGSGETNLTPSWPRYSVTSMQWLRFREAGGTLYFEYAAGADAPGTWTTLASTANPFALTAVSLELAAGSNLTTTDIARFDNVGTS